MEQMFAEGSTRDDPGVLPSAEDFWQAFRLLGDAFEIIVLGPELSDVSMAAVWAEAGVGIEAAWGSVNVHMADALRDYREQLAPSET